MNQINISKFELFQLNPNPSILILSDDKNIILNLFEHFQKFPAVVIFSTKSYYQDIIPNLFIHEYFSECVIERIICRQKLVSVQSNINPKILLIFDDIGIQIDKLKELLLIHRELNISVVLKLNKINTDEITNIVDYFMYKIIKPDNNTKQLYNCFIKHFNSYNQFTQLSNSLNN
jgi:hypothetical protein